MDKKKTHSVQILETPFSTVSNRGHWFYTTRAAVEKHLPGLLNFCTFEKLISRSIVWIDSANSLAMLLFLGLVFLIKPWPAIAISILRSEEHTSELQSRGHLVCRLLLENK